MIQGFPFQRRSSPVFLLCKNFICSFGSPLIFCSKSFYERFWSFVLPLPNPLLFCTLITILVTPTQEDSVLGCQDGVAVVWRPGPQGVGRPTRALLSFAQGRDGPLYVMTPILGSRTFRSVGSGLVPDWSGTSSRIVCGSTPPLRESHPGSGSSCVVYLLSGRRVRRPSRTDSFG